MPLQLDIGTSYAAGQASGDSVGNLRVTLPTVLEQSGYTRSTFELDSGSVTGTPDIVNPEIDVDYRLRIAQDTQLDEEVFSYTAQNTGKHQLLSTTMVPTFTAGQFTSNSTSITTVNTGVSLATYAAFPNIGTQTLSGDFEVGFSAQPTTNTFVEFGIGLPGTAISAPTDGVFFRLTSGGLQGIASNNGTETSTGIFPLSNGAGIWAYTNNKKYQFIVYLGGVETVFWVNDGTGAVKLGQIVLPVAQSRMTMSGSGQAFFKHRIVGGAAGGAFQSLLGAYNVRLGGANYTQLMSTSGNRSLGSYQGQSGGTMGSLATLPNSTNPVAAAPSNTALTANLPAGLGGQGSVTAAAAAATDGIWGSYQVPVATVNLAGRRLVLRGVKVSALNIGAAVATTATAVQFSLAYGHTAVSLATAESATTKAPRRVALGFATWAVGAGIGAAPQSGDVWLDLGDAPIFVNPGEFVQLVGKFVAGTATASQVITFTWTPVYGWE